MKYRNTRVVFTLCYFPWEHLLTAIILTGLSLLHNNLLSSVLRRRNICYCLLQRSSHSGGQPDQGSVHGWPGHGSLYWWSHFYNFFWRAFLVEVASDLLRLNRLHIAVLAQGAARGVQEGSEVS